MKQRQDIRLDVPAAFFIRKGGDLREKLDHFKRQKG